MSGNQNKDKPKNEQKQREIDIFRTTSDTSSSLRFVNSSITSGIPRKLNSNTPNSENSTNVAPGGISWTRK